MNKEISQRLRIFRDSVKESQEVMAIYLGIERGSYTQIETGKNRIKDEHLFRLQEKGLSLDWLFSGKGNMLLGDQANEPTHIYINEGGNSNHGAIAGSQVIAPTDCERDLSAARTEIELLRSLLQHKEIIIQLLNKKQGE